MAHCRGCGGNWSCFERGDTCPDCGRELFMNAADDYQDDEWYSEGNCWFTVPDDDEPESDEQQAVEEMLADEDDVNDIPF